MDLKLTTRELKWIVENEIKDLKPVIINVEDFNTNKYVEISFQFNNIDCYVSYRYTINNGISFPEDILKLKNIILTTAEDSDLKKELKYLKNENKKNEITKHSDLDLKLEKLSNEYKKNTNFIKIEDIKFQKNDLKELSKILKKEKSIKKIQFVFYKISLKYKCNIKELYSFILKKNKRI